MQDSDFSRANRKPSLSRWPQCSQPHTHILRYTLREAQIRLGRAFFFYLRRDALWRQTRGSREDVSIKWASWKYEHGFVRCVYMDGRSLCVSLWRDPVFFAGVDQTFIRLFWDARSCETCLAPDEVILKEQARTDCGSASPSANILHVFVCSGRRCDLMCARL